MRKRSRRYWTPNEQANTSLGMKMGKFRMPESIAICHRGKSTGQIFKKKLNTVLIKSYSSLYDFNSGVRFFAIVFSFSIRSINSYLFMCSYHFYCQAMKNSSMDSEILNVIYEAPQKNRVKNRCFLSQNMHDFCFKTTTYSSLTILFALITTFRHQNHALHM